MLNKVTQGFDSGAAATPNGGTRPKLWWINFDDLDFSSGTPYTFDADGKILTVALLAAKVALPFTGFRTDVKANEEVISMGLGPSELKHAASFVCTGRTQELKNTADELRNSKGVIVIENNGADTDAFEVLGAQCGLMMVAGKIRDRHENGGWFTMSFATLENEFETKAPATLGSSYASGYTIINALV